MFMSRQVSRMDFPGVTSITFSFIVTVIVFGLLAFLLPLAFLAALAFLATLAFLILPFFFFICFFCFFFANLIDLNSFEPADTVACPALDAFALVDHTPVLVFA